MNSLLIMSRSRKMLIELESEVLAGVSFFWHLVSICESLKSEDWSKSSFKRLSCARASCIADFIL